MRKIKALIVLTLTTAAILFSQNGKAPVDNTVQRVEIPNSQLVKLYSAIIGEEYNLYVHLPRNYDDTTKIFPVLYLLDAQWDFPLMSALFGQQYFDGFIPEMILVGITWGGKNPNPDSLRVRDFTPIKRNNIPQSGGADKFLTFLKNELIPFIDSKYRTEQDDRALAGSSLGGLFTLYSLFTDPEVFNRYIVTSPALGWGNGSINSFEKSFLQQQKVSNSKLFMAEGSLEDGVDEFEQFSKSLMSKKNNGFKIESKILNGIGHSGGKAEGYTRGLQFVYARPSLELSVDILDQYKGKYYVNDDITIELKREREHLVAMISGGSRFTLHAETENDFYVLGQYLFIHFVKIDQSNTISGFRLEQFGGERFIQKIK